MSPVSQPPYGSLPLHQFLRNEHEGILQEWERLNRATSAIAEKLSSEELRNHLPHILNSLADQAECALGGTQTAEVPKEGPKSHAEYRWRLGFSLEEVTREYALLRTVILQKLVPRAGRLGAGELVLLNETLDQAIIEAVMTYVASASRVLENERERLEVTLRSIGDAVVSTDTSGRITYFNPAAEKITGWPRHEALGRPVSEVLVTLEEGSRQPLESLTQVATQAAKLSQHVGEILLKRRNGECLPVEEIAAPLQAANGDFLGAVTTFRDVSTIRALTSQLGYLASHDPLTGLPNRTLLHDRLTQELAYAERHKTALALMYLDLDLFKDVNDVHGHSTGDEILKQVAERLRQCVRQTDTVSRLGGDEFAILVTEFERLTALGELSEKIARQISTPFITGSHTIDLSTSIGISIFPEDGCDPETLTKHADVAMYQAKARGRNNIQFFAPEMNKRATERRKLDNDLHKAIGADQLSLRFQPQIELSSRRLIGAEALVRWSHPQLGLVSPDRFIPVAEDNGQLMMSIGDWVLEHACQQTSAWRNAGHRPLRLSVNVSLVQLRYERFPQHVSTILQRNHLPPDRLQLELTESIIMSDIAGASDRVRELVEMGVRIVVDDFGTGYSSLSYLKDLPVDELKIDQSFVQGIGSDTDKAAIVEAIIRMGQSLKLRVIAEGVEDQSTVDFLTLKGCDAAQGYYYSKPITPDHFERQYLDGR